MCLNYVSKTVDSSKIIIPHMELVILIKSLTNPLDKLVNTNKLISIMVKQYYLTIQQANDLIMKVVCNSEDISFSVIHYHMLFIK